MALAVGATHPDRVGADRKTRKRVGVNLGSALATEPKPPRSRGCPGSGFLFFHDTDARVLRHPVSAAPGGSPRCSLAVTTAQFQAHTCPRCCACWRSYVSCPLPLSV